MAWEHVQWIFVLGPIIDQTLFENEQKHDVPNIYFHNHQHRQESQIQTHTW